MLHRYKSKEIVAMEAQKKSKDPSPPSILVSSNTRNVHESSLRSSPSREYHSEEPIRDVRAYQESRREYLPNGDHEGALRPTRPGWCWFDCF